MENKRLQLWFARALAALSVGALLYGQMPTRSGSISLREQPLFFCVVLAVQLLFAWWLHRDAKRHLSQR